MSRLTHERNNGIKTGYWSPAKKEELVQRLAKYENIGLEPEEIKALIKKVKECVLIPIVYMPKGTITEGYNNVKCE